MYVNFNVDQMIPQGHLLRRIQSAVDFSFVRRLVKDCYSNIDTDSVDPVVIFKLVLLGYLYNVVSERRLCERASYDLSWRWFLGYEVDDSTPTHSVLSKARRRFGPQIYEEFFAHVVKLCEQRGLIAGDVLYVDATISRADASLASLRARGLVEQLIPVEQYLEDMWVANEDAEDHLPPRPKKPRGKGSQPTGKPARKSEARANVEMVSVTDPDAQLFRKPGVPRKLAHKTHFATDGKHNVVTAILVRPGTEHDSQVMATVLEKHTKNVGRSPEAAVADKGYDSSAAMGACLKRGVIPVIAQKDLANSKVSSSKLSSSKSLRDDFIFDAQHNLYICPEGHQLQSFNENYQCHQTRYRPKTGTCQGCQRKPECAPGRADRTVTRPWNAEIKETASAMLQTPTAQTLLKRRSEVAERTNADAKVRHGFARAQFRRRWGMWIQAAMTAATINIKKLALIPARVTS